MPQKDLADRLETFLTLYSTNKKEGGDITSVFDTLSIRDESEQKILAHAASEIDTITLKYHVNKCDPLAALSGTCIFFSVGFMSAMAGLTTLGITAGALLGYFSYKSMNAREDKYNKEHAGKLIRLRKLQTCEELELHYGIQKEYQKGEEQIKKARYDIYMNATPWYLNVDDLDEQGVPREKKHIN